MAKFFQTASGEKGLRLTTRDETINPIPAGAAVVEFDPDTNAALLASLDAKSGFLWQDHAIVGGVLQRAGVPFPINPDGTDRQTRQALNAAQVAQALSDLDGVIAAMDTSLTVTQMRPYVKRMAQIEKALLKRYYLDTKGE